MNTKKRITSTVAVFALVLVLVGVNAVTASTPSGCAEDLASYLALLPPETKIVSTPPPNARLVSVELKRLYRGERWVDLGSVVGMPEYAGAGLRDAVLQSCYCLANISEYEALGVKYVVAELLKELPIGRVFFRRRFEPIPESWGSVTDCDCEPRSTFRVGETTYISNWQPDTVRWSNFQIEVHTSREKVAVVRATVHANPYWDYRPEDVWAFRRATLKLYTTADVRYPLELRVYRADGLYRTTATWTNTAAALSTILEGPYDSIVIPGMTPAGSSIAVDISNIANPLTTGIADFVIVAAPIGGVSTNFSASTSFGPVTPVIDVAWALP